MEDIAEQQETANEISDTLASPVGFGEDCDEVSRSNMFQLVYD